MTIAITPKTLAVGTNNSSRQVSATAWNAGHDISGSALSSVEFDGDGAAIEVQRPLTLEMFGGVADGVTDNIAAWNALNAYLDTALLNESTFYTGSREVWFPGENYYFSDTLQIKRTMRLRGQAVGQPAGAATRLSFAADKAGIVINRYNTLGDEEQSPTGRGGDATLIEGFFIVGGGGTVDGSTGDLLKSGIRMRGRAVVRDCYITGFAGAGICISAASASAASDAFHGNANCWLVQTCRIERNKAGGMYVSGGDANAGTAIGVDCSSNGRYGFFDSAFLGNAYIGCHSDANGLYGLISGHTEIGVVSYGGNRYYVKNGVSTATAQATTPGTDSSVWVPHGAGGPVATVPTWDGTGNYVPSGAYFHSGSANNTAFDGCYYETGQAPPQITGAAVVNGGFMGTGLSTGAPHLIGHTTLGLKSQRPFSQSVSLADGTSATCSLGGTVSSQTVPVLQWGSTTATPFNPGKAATLYNDGTTGDLVWNSYDLRSPVRFTGYSTARTYGGRAQADCRYTLEVDRLALGTGGGAADNCRVIVYGTAAPASGAHGRGEIVFNSAPSSGNPMGWICTAAGTPGTWAALANVA